MTDDCDTPANADADAKKAEAAQVKARKAKNSSKAKAGLEQELEQLQAKLNTERFLFVVAMVAILDAFVFISYQSWSQAICLTAIEAGGLFVLARYLEVDEFVSLLVEFIRNQRLPKSPKDDPSEGEA